jgi:pyrophosphate--fructose-6-phosphate 1-phosphotransferase
LAFSLAGTLGSDPQVREAFAHLETTVLQSDGFIPAPERKLRVAALFSGGPAGGGHNALVGLKHMLGDHTLLGVRNGPGGLLAGDMFEILDVSGIANTGGFDFLGTDRTKIKRPEQLAKVREVIVQHALDAIIIIGGDDSNTSAAILAEYLEANNVACRVVTMPKTMDGDVQTKSLLPCPFGYDTACRVYAELVGNILQDTPSSRKYWHFIKLMGRTASQVLLEVALQTQPHVALVSEELQERNVKLSAVVDSITDTVLDRAQRGMPYGVVLVPEGLLEFTPEFQALILEIDELFGKEQEHVLRMDLDTRRSYFAQHLEHRALYASLPEYIQGMLVEDRDAYGNLQVALISTERLLAELVGKRVKERAPGVKFTPQTHSFGYEGRCGAPTAFDAMLAYNLGLTAACLVLSGKTGYMAAMTDFTTGGAPLGIPLKSLLTVEEREGEREYVIRKVLVDTKSPAFKYFAEHRAEWAKNDSFNSPGPRQLWGPAANQLPKTVVLNQGYSTSRFSVG